MLFYLNIKGYTVNLLCGQLGGGGKQDPLPHLVNACLFFKHKERLNTIVAGRSYKTVYIFSSSSSAEAAAAIPWPVWPFVCVWGGWGTMFQKASSSQVICVLFKVIYSWQRMSTLLHYPPSFSSDGLEVDFPLARPGEQFCTESRAWWRVQIKSTFDVWRSPVGSLVDQQIIRIFDWLCR